MKGSVSWLVYRDFMIMVGACCMLTLSFCNRKTKAKSGEKMAISTNKEKISKILKSQQIGNFD